MRTSIIALTGKVTLAALLATATPSFAQEAEEEKSSEFTVSGNAALTTDYRFRGIGFSDGDIAVQGGIDVNHDSGFYVGVWGSSLEDSDTFGHTEVDIYGGWSGDIGGGLTADVGLLYFYFPNGNEALGGPSDFFEPYASISGDLGPASLTVGANYAWSQSAIADNDNIYLYTDLSVGVPQTPITLNAHFGYNNGSLTVAADNDYTDFSIGADYAVTSNLTASIAYISTGTDLPTVDGVTDDAVVFTLGVSF